MRTTPLSHLMSTFYKERDRGNEMHYAVVHQVESEVLALLRSGAQNIRVASRPLRAKARGFLVVAGG